MLARTLVTALLLGAGPALADTDNGENGDNVVDVAAEPPRAAVDTSLLVALQLPVLAQAMRAADVPAEDVSIALDAAKKHGLDAVAAADVLRRGTRAVREHGRIPNFGGFVAQQLEAGKRGSELAEAIRLEHATRGKKHGVGTAKAAAAPGQADGEHGKADAEHGKPGDEPGKAGAEHGKAGEEHGAPVRPAARPNGKEE